MNYNHSCNLRGLMKKDYSLKINALCQIENTSHSAREYSKSAYFVDQSKLTHEKWLKNPENAFLNKSEDAQKCIERSKCSYHSHGQAGAVGLLRD